MAITPILREAFQGVGTLDASTPGNLGTVTAGSLPKRPVGPRLSADASAQARGWSADSQGGYFAHDFGGVPDASDDSNGGFYFLDWWLYLDPQATLQKNAATTLVDVLIGSASKDLLRIDVAADGLTLDFSPSVAHYYAPGGSIAPYPLPAAQWVNLRFAWVRRSANSNQQDCEFFVRRVGEAAFTSLWAAPGVDCFGTVSSLRLGLMNYGGAHNPTRARYGLPSWYRADTWAERTTRLGDVVDPVPGPFAWFVDPVNGNDANDGTTAQTAWQSAAKVNLESGNLGLWPATTIGTAGAGDSLTIDLSMGNLVLGAAALVLATPGLRVSFPGSNHDGSLPLGTHEVQAWVTIPATAWSSSYGGARLGTLPIGNTPSSVVWEDDKWLVHITADSFFATATYTDPATGQTTTYNNVGLAMAAHPGSFWTDGNSVALAASDASDPATNGKVYTYSLHRGAPYGAAAVQRAARDILIDGLCVGKTCLADRNTNDPVAAYGVQSTADGGAATLQNSFIYYYGKHGVGWTDDSTTRQYTTQDVRVEQGTPYVGPGGQSPFVDYTGGAGTAGTATSTYVRPACAHNAGQIGSAAGQVLASQPSYLVHNNGQGGYQYAQITVTGASWPTSIGVLGGCQALLLRGGTIPGGTIGDSTVGTVDRCRVLGGMPFVGKQTTVTNSIIAIGQINAGFETQAAGGLSYVGCTIDLSATTTNGTGLAFLARAAPMSGTFRNNLFLGQGTVFAPFRGLTNADTLACDHNAYVNTSTLCLAYNDGSTTSDRTLAQWQALGKDANSFATIAPQIDASYKPAQTSPLSKAGANLGTLPDFTGAVYTTRNDIGAIGTNPIAILTVSSRNSASISFGF